MKRAASGLIFGLVLGFVAGCATPVVEIDYRCVFPNKALFDLTQDLSLVFADAIAHQANLQVLNQTRQTGMSPTDVTYIVSLRSKAAQDVFVNVLFNKPTRTVVLSISGNIRDPEATSIGQKANEVFSKLFPGTHLDLVQGKQNLFGP
ncbi:MAG TPA: hypothetical protein VGF85_11850 [Opitutaceae bacterium]|jgi:hypothetical protein